MTPLRLVIVDDEALARAVVREYASADPSLEILAECANGFDAVKAVAEHKPDLVLLDVQMPKLDGFEVLELIGTDQIVVFITAYDQYALRAFDVHAVDYLLKPFSAERFEEAMDRVRERVQARAAAAPDVAALVRDAKPRTGPAERVLIRDGANVHVLPVDAIDYVEAQDDYVAFKSDGKRIPEGSDAGRRRSDDWTRHASSGSTARICSTSTASRMSSSTRRTAGSPSSATARDYRSAAPATRGYRSCCRRLLTLRGDVGRDVEHVVLRQIRHDRLHQRRPRALAGALLHVVQLAHE